MSDNNIFNLTVNTGKLRKCQREAYKAALEHYSKEGAERNCIIQLPTGTGKTAVLAILPFGISKKKVLILTPNVKLARDAADALDIIQFPKNNIYQKLDLFDEQVLAKLELYILRLEKSADIKDINEHQIIVSNYHQLQDVEKWFQGHQDNVDLILIDEAHHQAANTYKQVTDFFPNAKVIGLTATPFRSDGKKVEGTVIYKYSFSEGIKDKVIRNVKVTNVAPQEIELSFTDEKSKKFTLEELLNLNEQSWFNRGIALSQDCCDTIARKAKEKLDELKIAFPNDSHQIIASAISKRHARENVKTAFEKLGLSVGLVSSDDADVKNNEQTFQKLKTGKLEVIIHIGMLGEGFDHPPLGVAAIFRPYKSLNPYIQFVGRVIRTNGGTEHCYVVSHLGLNQLKRFEEFRLFDTDDQQLLLSLTGEVVDGEQEASFIGDDSGGTAVTGEPKVSIFDAPTITESGAMVNIESEFVKPEHQVQQLLSQYGGLTPDAQKLFLQKLGLNPDDTSLTVKPIDKRIKPVDKRKASRSLLNEREKSIASDTVQSLGVKIRGRDFNPLYDNFTWIKKHVSKEMNKALGIEKDQRKTIDNQTFEKMEQTGVVKKVAEESLKYFTGKRIGGQKS